MKNFINFYRSFYLDNAFWFKMVVVLFVATFAVGIIAYRLSPDLIGNIMAGFDERFGLDPNLDFNLAMKIFLQNSLASGIALIGGIVLGLSSILVVAINGLLIGYVVAWMAFLTREDLVYSVTLIFGGLLPHGIFEIPAFLLAAALGLRLGWEWMGDRAQGSRRRVLQANLKRAAYAIPAIIVLLFVAAIIEVFVTGWIVGKM